MTVKNPFRPTFGSSPPELAGRDEELLLFDDAIEEGPGSPARAVLVLGTLADVESAHPVMLEKLGIQVLDPALQPLSDGDRRFLSAMSVDDGPSRIADIADRIGESHNYAQQYRKRLIDAELVVATSRGRIDMALPGLRAHLRRQHLQDDADA